MLDSPVETTPLINMYLGQDPESTDPKDLENVQKVLENICRFVKKFHSSEYISAMANGDACVALRWSGDFFIAKNSAEEAYEFLEPELRNNPILFPSEESLQNVYIKRPYDMAAQKKITRMWIKMKSGR